MHVTKLTKH